MSAVAEPLPAPLLFRLLLLRRPAAFEREDLVAAYVWLRRFAGVLLLVYLVWIGVTVVPALLRERSLAYHAIAVAVPHLLLWLAASAVARAWIGYRYYDAYPKAKTRTLIVALLAGGVTGFLFARYEEDLGGGVLEQWFSETFGSVWWLLALLFLLSMWPELLSRMRRRESRHLARIAQAEAAAERLARQTAESELRLLQAQVEPHFLYNTLANLRYLIQKGSADALRMTDALIEYLRTSVPDMRAERVPLGREVDHVRHFLEIMQMRMQGRLAFGIDVPEALRAVQMPPLVLLTLVENAVKHGIGGQVEGGRVDVSAREVGGRVRIEVADSGAGLDSRAGAAGIAREAQAAGPSPSTGTGLVNARSRLRLTYGESAELTLHPRAPRGAVAIAEFPLAAPARTPTAGALPAQPAAVDSAAPTGEPRRELRPLRHIGPRRTWEADWHGHAIRVVDSWFGGAELFVDGALRDVWTDVWTLPGAEPVMSARLDDGQHGAARVEVVLQPWSFHVRAAILVNGVRIGGDAL